MVVQPAGASPVALESVEKRFGDVVAVRDLDLQVRAGEFLVLLGPSGCGKSTVLRLVAGLEEPTAGRILIDGRDVTDVDPKDRDVAMVFQSYALYPHLSVRRNIEFPLRARGVERAQRDRLVLDAAHALALDDLLERKPAQLSGGQRQRVALARAIVRRPRAFLMDEPLSNLDAQLRVGMRAELVELHAQLGITVLYVTHDQTEAVTMGDRIAVMVAGTLQQLGTPEEVHDAPANAFVAGFVGSPPMNVVPATVHDEDGQLVAEVDGGRVVLPDAAAAAVRRAGLQTASIGIRPASLRLSPAGTIRARVAMVEPFGDVPHAACRLPGGQLVLVQLDPGHRPRTGEVVTVACTGTIHLFAPGDGRRIDAG